MNKEFIEKCLGIISSLAFAPETTSCADFFDQICGLMARLIYYSTDYDADGVDFKEDLIKGVIIPFYSGVKNGPEVYLNFVYEVSERIFRINPELFPDFYKILGGINNCDDFLLRIELYNTFFDICRITSHFSSFGENFDPDPDRMWGEEATRYIIITDMQYNIVENITIIHGRRGHVKSPYSIVTRNQNA